MSRRRYLGGLFLYAASINIQQLLDEVSTGGVIVSNRSVVALSERKAVVLFPREDEAAAVVK